MRAFGLGLLGRRLFGHSTTTLVGALSAQIAALLPATPDAAETPDEPLVWVHDSTNALVVAAVHDTGTDEPIASATVVATVWTLDNVLLSTLPVAPVAGSGGAYQWRGQVTLTKGARYRLRVRITVGVHVLELWRGVLVRRIGGAP